MSANFTYQLGAIDRLSKSVFFSGSLADRTEERAVAPVTGLPDRADPEALTQAPME